MADDFKEQIKAIAEKQNSVAEKQEEAAATSRTKLAEQKAATQEFANQWRVCLNKSVRPWLEQIVSTLAEQKISRSLTLTNNHKGAVLTVPLPESRGLASAARRARPSPQLSIMANLDSRLVEIKHVNVGYNGNDQSYQLDQITLEVLQQHTLTLVKKVYDK